MGVIICTLYFFINILIVKLGYFVKIAIYFVICSRLRMSITYITDLLEKTVLYLKNCHIERYCLMKVYVKSIKCWILFE